MSPTEEANGSQSDLSIPWFGVRRVAHKLAIQVKELRAERDTKSGQLERLTTMGRELVTEVKTLRSQRVTMLKQMEELGIYTVVELENKRQELANQISEQSVRLDRDKSQAAAELEEIRRRMKDAQAAIVATDDLALLQEVGVYRYRHPLSDAVAYQNALAEIDNQIKSMVKKDGGAVLATTSWTVNSSATEGRKMVRDFSKLMLRAFNAEADNLVRGMKPYKLDSALDRLAKTSQTIERLGKTMQIRISPAYYALRVRELEITSDFLQKQAEEKEVERAERERLREERKAQQEIENERARLEKERQHYSNAIDALVKSGDETGAARIREQLRDVDEALENVDYRAANIRAGYVYVISNIGSFGEKMIKVGMTRRLDPMDRIRELSDASVPFNFDVHALFFSKDAVSIETEMHSRLGAVRVNTVNRRREFFRATPLQVKAHLSELTGELLEFQEAPEALEYRQSLRFASV
ncbi:MAG: hypothetical protein QOI05_827 [Bradyrhizobium sp.]|jgi:hypothetical protein|nr:hypothetical protein [Bradyrhizobium sp.]